MKRLLAIAALLLAAIVVLVLGTGASGGGGDGYRVRAIFDNAASIVAGEDVKVAGVKVGTIASLDVTPDKKAAVVLEIDDPAFQDFKQDAHCTIRPQSLIGEKFVECTATEPKDANAAPAPSLPKITNGPGKGEYLLPVQNTSSPVDIDLINDVMRLPERQRLAIIVNELGTGLAGNGTALREVIRRADPALEATDKVLAIFARQNKVLADLATSSDADLAPLAHNAQQIQAFIDKAGQTAAATAERGDALEQDFQKFPEFLAQLTPTAQRLADFAEQGTPVLENLKAAAPSLNRIVAQLGPFSTAALPAVRTLGTASRVGTSALPAARPLVQDLRQLGVALGPFSKQLSTGLASLQQNFGFNRLMDLIYGIAMSANQFDSAGHFLRAVVFIGGCNDYNSAADTAGCPGNFADTFNKRVGGSGAAASAGSSVGQGANQQRATPIPTSRADGATTSTDAQTGLLNYLLGNGGSK